MSPGPATRGVAVRDALDSALVALGASGVESPRLDAEVLLAHALGVDRSALIVDPDRELGADASRWFREAVRRRAIEREPVAYITGTRGFRWIDLAVDSRVLIPRPETETLVDAVLELAPEGARVHDTCTGSGAVALALAQERPDLSVSGSDVSADAVAAARENAARLGLAVEFAVSDLLAGAGGDFDVICANPPYVTEGERESLVPEITRHEPAGALFAGADGLDVIRRLVEQVQDTRAAAVALELGAGQAERVRALFGPEWETGVRCDLAGIERVVVARR